MDLADSNHGALVNGATFASGAVGQAFSFDGVDDTVIVPDASNLNPPTQVSIEAWVFPTANSGSPDVVATIVNKKNFATLGAQCEIARRNDVTCPSGTGIPSGNLTFSLGGVIGLPNDCIGWVDGYASLPLNTWSHVALTFDGAAARAYVNGVLSRVIAVSGTVPITDGFLRRRPRDATRRLTVRVLGGEH
ncbi:MAG TPA: LamG-like jellyroll fold domain-containing protein [Alphaproteobacteria bacterium]|nr:LamG-like jellyroll fold domain-containing protein [Alphaproteobacteria bacterium]